MIIEEYNVHIDADYEQGNEILEVPQNNDFFPLYNIDDPDYWLEQINGKILNLIH